MAGISFRSTILILTANLVIQSFCLDIHHPEYAQVAPAYDYPQNIQAAQQIHYPYPLNNGGFYQGQALDESYHHQADYHRALSQQNYGHVGRRSPQPTFRQSPCALRQQQDNLYRCYRSIPARANFPGYPYCNIHNSPTANNNQGAGSFPIRGRDSRSAMESPETQIGDDVAARSRMMIPMYLSNSPIDLNDGKDKRAAQPPPTSFHERPNKRQNVTIIKPITSMGNIYNNAPIQPATTTIKTTIIGPSRKYVNPNATPKTNAFQGRDAPIDYPTENYFGRDSGAFGRINSTMTMGGERPSESDGERHYYSHNNPEYPKIIGPQMPSENLSRVSAVSSVDTRQPMTTKVLQPISNYGTASGDKSYNPYDYFKSRTADSLPSASSSSTTNNSKLYPIYTPNVNRTSY